MTMGNFHIDFFELLFLSQSCIPPVPIARTHFWDKLTNVHWGIMTEDERLQLFNSMNENIHYKKGLEEKNENILIFHHRFDPNNQYIVHTTHNRKKEKYRTFLHNDEYHITKNSFIQKEKIKKIEKYLED
jgi:hypothetical protein